MKIGLWSDSHNFPNLALMKLAAYHKSRGDQVEMLDHLNRYETVYCSKVFDFTPDADESAIIYADRIVKAGTGYGDLTSRLPDEIEHQCPDYSIYPLFKGTAYGFLTRGCPRNCQFCCVSKKEGCRSLHVSDLSEFWHGERFIKLLDPNLLACLDSERLLRQLAESGAWIDITQGFDIRLVNSDNIGLLNKLKVEQIHFAWDNPNVDLTDQFRFFIQHTTVTKHRLPTVYILTNFWSTLEQDLYRVYTLRDLGYNPFVMIYNKVKAPRKIRLLQRWVNNKKIFKRCERFEDYDPKRG